MKPWFIFEELKLSFSKYAVGHCGLIKVIGVWNFCNWVFLLIDGVLRYFEGEGYLSS